MATMCPNDCGSMQPFDVLEAWVNTIDGATVVYEADPHVLKYEPTGFTQVLWDTQRTIGHGCPICGVLCLADRLVIGGVHYVKKGTT